MGSTSGRKQKGWNLTFHPVPVLSLGLAQPRALSFSEVGPRSFRASWEIDSANAESFLVQFKPADDPEGHYVSLSVPGNTLTALLPNLQPLTRYEVNVHAQYEKGASIPVTGYETTAEGIYCVPSDIHLCFSGALNHHRVAERGPVRNLRVSEETTESFRVSWQPAPGDVTRYRLTYQPVGDESSKMETTTIGPETTTALQGLQPQTTYRVTVTPEYQTGAGVPLQTDGTTKEG